MLWITLGTHTAGIGNVPAASMQLYFDETFQGANVGIEPHYRGSVHLVIES